MAKMSNYLVDSNDFKSRNQFLAFVLFIFGLIQFAAIVRSAEDITFIELFSSAAFFTTLGAFMTLYLLQVDTFDHILAQRAGQISIFITCFILYVGMFMYMTAGAYYARKSNLCDSNTGCSAKVFGETALIAAYANLMIGLDLYNQMFDKRRIRIVAYSFIILVSCVLMIIYFGKEGSDALSHSEKSAAAGFAMVMVATLFSFLLVGILNQTEIAVFNWLVSFACYIGTLLILAFPDILTSVIVVWWLLFAAIVYLHTVDLQAGGTIKVRRSVTDNQEEKVKEAVVKEDVEEEEEQEQEHEKMESEVVSMEMQSAEPRESGQSVNSADLN